MLYSYWWRGYDIDILSYCTVKKRKVKIRDKACYIAIGGEDMILTYCHIVL